MHIFPICFSKSLIDGAAINSASTFSLIGTNIKCKRMSLENQEARKQKYTAKLSSPLYLWLSIDFCEFIPRKGFVLPLLNSTVKIMSGAKLGM